VQISELHAAGQGEGVFADEGQLPSAEHRDLQRCFSRCSLLLSGGMRELPWGTGKLRSREGWTFNATEVQNCSKFVSDCQRKKGAATRGSNQRAALAGSGHSLLYTPAEAPAHS